MKIWVTKVINHRIESQYTCEIATGSRKKALTEAAGEACAAFELSRPLIMGKHLSDFEKFSRARFTPDDFIGEDGFNYIEIEIIDNKKKKKNIDEYI